MTPPAFRRFGFLLALLTLGVATAFSGVAPSGRLATGAAPPSGASGRLVTQPAEYDVLQLEKWYAQLRDHVWQVESLVWTDIDERLNRIALGVGTVEGKARLEAIIRRVGVPPDAVIIDLPERALSEADPLAGCRTREKPPEPDVNLPFTLELSDDVVVPGQEIVVTVAGAEGREALRGVDAYLDCWDGNRWSPRFAMYSELAGSGPSTKIYNAHAAVPGVGFDASRPARFILPDRLSPGWYRIRMHVSTTEGGSYKGHDLYALVRVATDAAELREALEGAFRLTLPDAPELDAALRRLTAQPG